MQCRTCGYRLWNLESRRCPECGTDFLPSQYEFVPGSVRFSCPHCRQSYYGTDARGHLVPIEFDCVKCGRHVHMDQMILLPTEGLHEEQTQVDIVPWLERKEYGRVKAWFSMIGRALVGQARLMHALPMHSSVAPAWWFTLITQFLIYCFMLLPMLVFVGGIPFMPMRGGISIGGIFASIYGLSIIAFVASALVCIVIWGLIAHLVLLLTGSTASTIGRTYQALCYSSGALAISAIPCLGLYVLWITWPWWIVSAILMVKEGQKVHGGRATLAVLTGPILVMVLSGVGMYFIPWSSMNSRFSGPGIMTARASSQALPVQTALQIYVGNNAGQWPAHASYLIINGYLSSSDLLNASHISGSNVPVADTTLNDFDTLTTERQKAVVQAAAAALPKGVVAHRLGDYVFTYHNIPRADMTQPVWLFIRWSNDIPISTIHNQQIVVGLLNGTTKVYSPGQFASELVNQNRLRASLKLPALPHPKDVTHTQPAVGE